jgi:halimadienyl-diphosphate synthase
MPDWYEELVALFREHIGKGEMAGTAYDTAWVASVRDLERPDHPAFPQALEWLRLHQHSDGSWGAEIEYYHDRVISTLIACIVLAEWHPDEWADYQIEAGLRSIWRNMTSLQRDPYEPVGFDLIVPTLLDRAMTIGLRLPYKHFDSYRGRRERKLAMIPPYLLYSRRVPTTYSLEFIGSQADAAQLNGNLREGNGSIGSSPSATSFFFQRTKDPEALVYISDVVHHARGGIPCTAPIEVFEQAWCLYNLYLVNECLPPGAKTMADALLSSWSDQGIGFSQFYSVPDLDDTALAFAMLVRAGHPLDLAVFRQYEEDDHFRCFLYERDASRSAHCHLLEALAACPPSSERQRMMDKVIGFLRQSQVAGSFWFDKWHASPYYTTSHAVFVALDFAPELVAGAIEWIIQTQRPDGTWGYLSGTAEETAYGLQALAFYKRRGGQVPSGVLQRAAEYLTIFAQRQHINYPAQWIAKILFAPTWVVHSAVLGALAMYVQL